MSVEETYQAFMLDHAAGRLPPGLSAAAGLHEALSEEGRRTARVWQAVKSELDRVAMLQNASRSKQDDHDAVTDLLLTDFDNLRWQRGLSGIGYAGCGVRGGKFMRLEPAQSVPTHGHSTTEATVVLEGQLTDGHDTYHEGEIMLAVSGERHKPLATGNTACICFVAKGSKAFWRLT